MKEIEQRPSVAFFPDSFGETNGAAMTCRRLVDYAACNGLPMLCVSASTSASRYEENTVVHHVWDRSPLSISVDDGLAFDPLFLRNYRSVMREVVDFRPDIIHITGLNDVSIIGACLAHKLDLPLIASWHTNLHEFAASRLQKVLSFIPPNARDQIVRFVEENILNGSLLYYRMPKVVLSPNRELIDLIAKRTGRLSLPMTRGVDSDLFNPGKRTAQDSIFRIGFVGRLRAEKNVRALIDIERGLLDAGKTDFQFLIVGDGSERSLLESSMRTAEFTGFIEGAELAEAYANMDVFVFPSETDAFGNVVQEAFASGVPAIVSDKGGPKFIVRDGETGYIASNIKSFVARLIQLIDDREQLRKMAEAARHDALRNTWPSIFEGVYSAYSHCIELHRVSKAEKLANPRDSVASVTRRLLNHPVKEILLRWNWKTALLSALFRAPVFLAAYLQQRQGISIAVGAMAVQFLLRFGIGGLSGGILQSFRNVAPAWHAGLTIPLFLAASSHALEFVVQSLYDSATNASGSALAVLVSVLLSIVSALFNLFAMRRGVLLVNSNDSQSFGKDLIKMPRTIFDFMSYPFRRPAKLNNEGFDKFGITGSQS